MAKNSFNKISRGEMLGIELYLHVQHKDITRQDVRRLIREGASLTVRNTRGNGLVQRALLAGNSHVLDILIDAGADFTSANGGGFTPAMVAVMTGDVKAGRILGRHGADISKAEALRVLQLLYDEEQRLRATPSGRDIPEDYFINRAVSVLYHLRERPENGTDNNNRKPPAP